MMDSYGCVCGLSNPNTCKEYCVRQSAAYLRIQLNKAHSTIETITTTMEEIPYHVLAQSVDHLVGELADWQNDYLVLKQEHTSLQNMYSTLLDKAND